MKYIVISQSLSIEFQIKRIGNEMKLKVVVRGTKKNQWIWKTVSNDDIKPKRTTLLTFQCNERNSVKRSDSMFLFDEETLGILHEAEFSCLNANFSNIDWFFFSIVHSHCRHVDNYFIIINDWDSLQSTLSMRTSA